MDEKLNKNPAEAQALTDEELDQASGGRHAYHTSGQAYACDACMVWISARETGRWIHKCGREMRYLQTAAERKTVTENPQYQNVLSGEAHRD